jgi:glycerol-3-phosphate acyltransferase PlsY
MTAGLFVIAALVGYIFGSIPFGLLIGRAFAKRDVRQVGSGKIGMTNVMRTAGKKAGAISLLLDMGKAAAAVLVAGAIFSTHTAVINGVTVFDDYARTLAALTAICGHSWSIFLKFRGGRGVATFIGGLLAIYWPAALVGGGLMLLIGFWTKYMSLGSIIGAVAAFIMTMSLSILEINFGKPYPPIEAVIYTMLCAIFIYVMHRDNVARLMTGTERKIGEKAKAEASSSSGHVE